MNLPRTFISYWMWRLGVQPLLPAQWIGRIPIQECGENLVELVETERLKLDHRLGVRHLARHSVAAALQLAAQSLPTGLTLIVVEAYRSRQRQLECWKKQRAVVAARNPDRPAEEIDRQTRLVVADPTRGGLGGHQTGGAVDVTLADDGGKELWMGTAVQEFSDVTPTARPPDSAAAIRRKVLCDCMRRARFANYPGEWWHFSLYDQLWAAYTRHPSARYGPMDE